MQSVSLALKRAREVSIANKFILAFGMAGLTGLLAQVRMVLPWTPVPITGQTLAVLLSGVMLGRNWGGISQAIYVVLGVAGIPWFNGFTGGYSVLLTPSGGYLLGFIFSAFFIGYVTDKYLKARSFAGMLAVMSFASFVIVYVPGLLLLGLWWCLVNGSFPGTIQLITMGAAPFVIGDALKTIMAASIAAAILPKE